jgi:hypothetical protein
MARQGSTADLETRIHLCLVLQHLLAGLTVQHLIPTLLVRSPMPLIPRVGSRRAT